MVIYEKATLMRLGNTGMRGKELRAKDESLVFCGSFCVS